MITDYENIEARFLKKKFPAIYDQYMQDVKEHHDSCLNDPYYRFSCGGGTVPYPCCKYCWNYDGDRCMKDWNNAEEDYYLPDRDDKEPRDLCEYYSWNGEWEED